MKKIRKTAAMLLAMLMIFTLFSCGKKEPADDPENAGEDIKASEEKKAEMIASVTELEVAQTVTAPDGEEVVFGVRYGEDGRAKLYDEAGQDVLGKDYAEMFELEEAGGKYTVRSADDGMNTVGLIGSDGREYIPCEAAEINALSDRYLDVLYAENETDPQTEKTALTVFSRDLSKLYTARAKIYDLKNERFVPGLEFSAAVNERSACGNVLLIATASDEYEIYDDAGEKKGTFPRSSVLPCGDCLVVNDGGSSVVYDADFKKAASFGYDLTGVYGGMKYFCSADRVTDRNGKDIFEGADAVYYDGFFSFSDGNYNINLTDETGKEILPFGALAITELGSGYLEVYDSDTGTRKVVCPDGKVIENVEKCMPLAIYRKAENGYDVMRYSDGTYPLHVSRIRSISASVPWLFFACGEDGLYAVFNALTLEPLTEYKYLSAELYGDKLILQTDGGADIVPVPSF